MTTLLTPQSNSEPAPPIVSPTMSPRSSERRVGPPALLVDDVSKVFVVGRRKSSVNAISHVSLRLERGDIHGILGANGSGKSTLIRLVCGLLTLDTGRVEVFGHDLVRDEMAVKRLINRVSVDAAFFKKLSPMENLLFAARLYGLDGRDGQGQRLVDPGPAGDLVQAGRSTDRADEPRDAAEGRDRAGVAHESGPAAA